MTCTPTSAADNNGRDSTRLPRIRKRIPPQTATPHQLLEAFAALGKAVFQEVPLEGSGQPHGATIPASTGNKYPSLTEFTLSLAVLFLYNNDGRRVNTGLLGQQPLTSARS